MEVPHFKDISVDEAEQFLSAVRKILGDYPVDEFYLGRTAFAISFDKDWYPFMLRRIGYNPKEERVEFPFGIKLLNRIAKILEDQWLEEGGIPGGRVFVDLSGVKKKDRWGREIRICTWDWPLKQKN